MSGMTAAQITMIFVEGDIAALMRTSLDTPVGQGVVRQELRASDLGVEAGDAIGGGRDDLAGIFVEGAGVELEDLFKIRPVGGTLEEAASGQGAGLDATTANRSLGMSAKVGFGKAEAGNSLIWGKQMLDIFAEIGLIVFDLP